MAYVNKSQAIKPDSKIAPTADAKQRQSNQNTPLPLSRYSKSSSFIWHLESESVLLRSSKKRSFIKQRFCRSVIKHVFSWGV